MNKQAYLIELRQRLSPLSLSMEDINEAVQYYDEYFTEAGPEREQEVIAELGSPAYVAAQIGLKLTGTLAPESERADGAASRPKVKSRGMSKAILLGVLAAPVALPLVAAAALTILSLMLAAFSFVFSFGVTGVALCAAAVITALFGVSQLAGDFATGIYWLGGGLLMFGLGGFLARLGVWMGRLCVRAVTFVGGRVLDRAGKKRAPGKKEILNQEIANAEMLGEKIIDLRTEAGTHAQEN